MGQKLFCKVDLIHSSGGPYDGAPTFLVSQGEDEYGVGFLVKRLGELTWEYGIKVAILELESNFVSVENEDVVEDFVLTVREQGWIVKGHGSGQVRPSWWNHCNYKVVHLMQPEWLQMPVQEIRYYAVDTLEGPFLNGQVHKDTWLYVIMKYNKNNLKGFLTGAQGLWRLLPERKVVKLNVLRGEESDEFQE